jgi:hypothetical protein
MWRTRLRMIWIMLGGRDRNEGAVAFFIIILFSQGYQAPDNLYSLSITIFPSLSGYPPYS